MAEATPLTLAVQDGHRAIAIIGDDAIPLLRHPHKAVAELHLLWLLRLHSSPPVMERS